jgi:NAD(P)-dependent dehydrogenase (short-subunit alcohol dehydrogenase family)
MTASSAEPGTVSLDGRVVLVTGASRGLGEAYARALAEHGARLVVTGRDAERLQSVADELPEAVAVAGDVSAPGFAARAVDEAVRSFGQIDVLVNNAGGVRDRTLLKMSDDEFDEVMKAHAYGTFYMTRAAATAMRDGGGGGTVINVGSDSYRGVFGQTNYAAAKGAVASMTLTWALELPRHGITCNCVLPNALTAMTEPLEQVLEEYRYGPRSSFPRALGEASEAAPLVVMLASGRWSGLNGAFLSLGGDKLSMWTPPQELRTAFHQGGWTVADLERSTEFALGIDVGRAPA